jgi:hypothetical protein
VTGWRIHHGQRRRMSFRARSRATVKGGHRQCRDLEREFVEWYCSEPRLAFTRTIVLRYRISLEQRQFAPAQITNGRVFRSINMAGRIWGDGMTPKVLWEVVRDAATRSGIEKLAPHDLRRTVRPSMSSGGRRVGSDSISAWACFHSNYESGSSQKERSKPRKGRHRSPLS